MPKKTPKQKPASPPVEYRAEVGAAGPSITLYLSGERKETVLSLTREPRDITARIIAQQLNRAFELGARLGIMATQQEQEATNTTATPAAEQEQV